MNKESIILSVCVVSHEQRELLKRCLESILSQIIYFPWEVIVSDDRSTDGTYELATEYAKKYPEYKRQDIDGKVVYLPRIIAVKCNSDECNPINRGQRCGWNKLNAWRYAKGKYMVNVDADDYLGPINVYQQQIELLESHPECSMCLQRALVVEEGKDIKTGWLWPGEDANLYTGRVFSLQESLQEHLRCLNQCYMMRRHPEDDMVKLYGRKYDDINITYHHFQYGPVVFLDCAGYIYIEYAKSISHAVPKLDTQISYALIPVTLSLNIPSLQPIFIKYSIRPLTQVFKLAFLQRRCHFRQDTYENFLQKKGFIYKRFTEKHHSLMSDIRVLTGMVLSYILRKLRKNTGLTQLETKIIWRLLV